MFHFFSNLYYLSLNKKEKKAKMNFMLTFLNLFFLQFKISAGSICPIENDPLNLARCIQVDIASILYAVKNANDLTPVCLLADRYMECIKTYSRGCIGFYVCFRDCF
jgi:hypothetical protein